MPSVYDIDVQGRTILAIAEVLNLPTEDLNRDIRFVEDLNIDSLDQVEIVMELEDEFGIQIMDEEVEPLATIGQMIDYLERRDDLD